MKKNETIQFHKVFEEFIKASTTGKRLLSTGKKITGGALENYNYALKLIEEFEIHLGEPLRIMILNRASLSLIKKEKQYWQKFFTGFTKYLFAEKKYYDNYVAATFKIIKSVFNYVKFIKCIPIGDFHKSFRVSPQAVIPVVLLPEQVHFLIHDLDFEKGLPQWLRRTKDIFIFGCTTGLRIGDLMALQHKNIVINNNECYLAIYTQKTNSYVKIPLPEYCLNIINRYRSKNKRYLLPRLSNTNINLQIKEIGKLAGWNWVLPKYRTRQGKFIEQKIKGQSWKFYQHLTAHTMRRTAITTLLMLGVEEAVVRRLSGHAPASKEFYKYVALAQSYMDNQVKMAYQRLHENPGSYKSGDQLKQKLLK